MEDRQITGMPGRQTDRQRNKEVASRVGTCKDKKKDGERNLVTYAIR